MISALGTREISLFRPVTLMSEATRTLVGVMRQQGVSRLVCITGRGASDSADHGGFLYERLIKPIVLRTIYEDKDQQKEIVKETPSTGPSSGRQF